MKAWKRAAIWMLFCICFMSLQYAVFAVSVYTPLAVTDIGPGGDEVSWTAASTGVEGFAFSNNGSTYILVQKNVSANTALLTIETGATSSGMAIADVVQELSASAKVFLFGPFPTATFNVPSGDDENKVIVKVTGAGKGDVYLSAFK